MTDNESNWPPGQRDPRLFQPPRPMEPPPPLHHDPRAGDPRSADPEHAGDSPWRRTQRHSRPESAGWQPATPEASQPAGWQPTAPEGAGWQPATPAPAGPGAGPGPGEYRGGDPEPYRQPDEGDSDTGGRFVPGFGDYAEEDYHAEPPRRGRAARGRSAPPPGPPRRPRRRRFRWIAPLAALAVILIPIAVGGAYAYSFYMSKYHPADYSGAGTGRVVVQIPSGATPTSLGPELTKLGVVASARAFVLAAEHSSNQDALLPGFYGVHLHMQATQAYALLIDPQNLVQVTVTIPEGWRLSQIVAYLGAKSGIPAANYQTVLKDPAKLSLPAYAGGKAEGYLFPATYEVQPHETALGVLAGMVQRFDQEAAAINLPAAAAQVHLTQGQVITMASLVEAEGGRISDYPKIARVIYNRLAQGIPLQLDSTVLYGLNTYGIIASDAQLNSPSPYNTYRHKGLTPGPIDSPGDAAIKAVLHPAAGNWLYFVTVNPKTGETLFTSSQAQFEQFRAELEHNLGQG
jgi:UPF0755 protein